MGESSVISFRLVDLGAMGHLLVPMGCLEVRSALAAVSRSSGPRSRPIGRNLVLLVELALDELGRGSSVGFMIQSVFVLTQEKK